MYSSLKEAFALLERDEWVKPLSGPLSAKSFALALVLGCCTVLFSPPALCSLQDGSLQALPKCLFGSDAGHTFALHAGIRRGKPILRYCGTLSEPRLGAIHFESSQAALPIAFDAEGVFFRASHRLGDALGLLAEDIEHIQNLYLRCVFPTVIAPGSWRGTMRSVRLFFAPCMLGVLRLLFSNSLLCLPFSVSINGTR